jgi:hypothetical protein
VTATDAAVWIAAVSATSALAGTVASSIYQGRQLRLQEKLLRQQAEFLGFQTDDLRETASTRLSEQASRVKLDSIESRLMPKFSDDYSPTERRFPALSNDAAVIASALVVNNSDRPVRQVQVRFENGQSARWARIENGTTGLPTPLKGLGPARSAWFDSDYRKAYTFTSVALRFTDVRDQHWQVDFAGNFEEIASRDDW